MPDHTVYNRAIDALKDAGYSLVRHGRHAVWKSADDKKGVVLSHNMRNKHLARAILRSVGISARL
jgi:hypothetical protein